MENDKYLASVSLFSLLYNEKKDVYIVLSEFLKNIIVTRGLYEFSSTEITNELNNSYDFSIPEAVVKTALKKIPQIDLNNYRYVVKGIDNEQGKKFVKNYEDSQIKNKMVISELASFIEKKDPLLSKDEKEITKAFCSYFLDDACDKRYLKYVSEFILKSSGDEKISKILRSMKEGVVIYSGIKYTSDLNSIGSWTSKLTIYLETEILFFLAGYNGELDKILFDDFFKLISEINGQALRKNGEELIYLKYFKETNNEILSFFNKAEDIVEKKEMLDPSKQAMVNIVNGCKERSDVVAKREVFLNTIRQKGITLDETRYYTEENYPFNIEDQKIVSELENEFGEENKFKIEESLKLLNYINILRKGDKHSIEDAKFILLTGGNITHKISKAKSSQGCVPLSTTMSYLTDRFWFKLNKGFGGSGHPKSFEVTTKAQLILATQLNESVSEKFERLKKDIKSGKKNNEEIVTTLTGLRNSMKNLSNISENVEEIIKEIDESDANHFIKEHDLLKTKLKEQELKNLELEKQIQDNEPDIKMANKIKIFLSFFKKISEYFILILILLAILLLLTFTVFLLSKNDILKNIVGAVTIIIEFIFLILKIIKDLKK